MPSRSSIFEVNVLAGPSQGGSPYNIGGNVYLQGGFARKGVGGDISVVSGYSEAGDSGSVDVETANAGLQGKSSSLTLR